MKKIIVVLILIVINNLHSQTKVTGKVYLLSSNWRPIEGVFIAATDSNGDYSKKDGSFALYFKDKQPGEIIRISVGNGESILDKNGKEYEVVNEKELTSILICQQDKCKTDLIIVLVPKGQREKVINEYYQIIKNHFDKRMVLLKRELKELSSQNSRVYDSVSELELQISNLKLQNDSLRVYDQAEELTNINKDSSKECIKKYLLVLDSLKRINLTENRFLSIENKELLRKNIIQDLEKYLKLLELENINTEDTERVKKAYNLLKMNK
ncbi:hypothetical protein [Flavivirga eckloniae]|uniref:Uncharacterized protein n=1 Tax=Flavivirga eckloniae TaxID=1803846 RepID=A0A2K9PWL4_9FLAO|nr:hypothetical protein [Flavivirga eckloniae]AUP81228.1 hypothetical protein C1H87_21925 [Flavivirga eckloniae]